MIFMCKYEKGRECYISGLICSSTAEILCERLKKAYEKGLEDGKKETKEKQK